MFYYGLDFHDLAPDSILHISAFIVVREAFLRITPHFGLWLKTFNVQPRKVGRQAGLGRQQWAPTPWLTERHGYDPTERHGYDPTFKRLTEETRFTI